MSVAADKAKAAFHRLAACANSGITVASAALTVSYVGLIMFEVAARYLFSASQSWTFELASYLFLISVFLGTATGFWERTHLSVVEPVGDGIVARGLRLLSDLICLVICAVLVWFGYRYAVAGLGRVSPSMGFKMTFVYAWVPVAFLLSVYFIAVRWLGGSK